MPYLFFPLSENGNGVLVACSDLELLRREVERLRDAGDDDPYEGFDWESCELQAGCKMARLKEIATAPEVLVFDDEPEHVTLDPGPEAWDSLVEQGGNAGLLVRVLSEAAEGKRRIPIRAKKKGI